MPVEEQEEHEEVIQAWENLRIQGDINPDVDILDYLFADDDLVAQV